MSWLNLAVSAATWAALLVPNRDTTSMGERGTTDGTRDVAGAQVQRVSPPPGSALIDPAVYSKLQACDRGRVFVCLDFGAGAKDPAGEHTSAVDSHVNVLEQLGALDVDEFRLVYRSAAGDLLFGGISARGLARLASSGCPVHVSPSKIEAKVFDELGRSSSNSVTVIIVLQDVGHAVTDPLARRGLVRQIQQQALRRLDPSEITVKYQYGNFALLGAALTARGLVALQRAEEVIAIGIPITFEDAVAESVPFLGADQLHAMGYTGEGVTVALLDTGVRCDWHPVLEGACTDDRPAFVNGMCWADPYDYVGHGTYMAAIIAAVAPGARILPVKVRETEPYNALDVVAGIDYVVNVKGAHSNLRIINMSFHITQPSELYSVFPCDAVDSSTAALAEALETAATEQIIVFTASGNLGQCDQMGAPACISHAVPVAAVYDREYGGGTLPHMVTSFSNRLPMGYDHVFLGAPGYQIDFQGSTPNGQGSAGTSQACAHASGVAALMAQKAGCPGLTPEGVALILDYTGTELWFAGDPCVGTAQFPSSINAITAQDAFSASCSASGHPACTEGVTILDMNIFVECMLGPGGSVLPSTCICLDYPEYKDAGDGDVDLVDFARFQQDFTGWSLGACCLPTGNCMEVTPPECFGASGLYQGNGTNCAGVNCPVPNWGACCHADGSCAEDTVENCIWGAGTYLGGGTQCATVECPSIAYQNFVYDAQNPTYTACGTGLALADDMTLVPGSPNRLAYYDLTVYGGGSGGTFDVTVSLHTGYPPENGNKIAGTERSWAGLYNGAPPTHLCATFDPTVTLPNNSLWMKSVYSNAGAGWFIGGDAQIGSTGDYFARYDPPWNKYWWQGNPPAGLWATLACVYPRGACCHPDHSCTEGTPPECAAVGGTYQGDDTTCGTVNCNVVTGACCHPDGSCTLGTHAECTASGGNYKGDGTTCATVQCQTTRYSNTVDPITSFYVPGPGLSLADDLTLSGAGSCNLIHYELLVYRQGGTPYNVTVSLHTACAPTPGNLIAGTTASWTGLDAGYGWVLEADLPPVTIPATVWMEADFSVADAGWIIAEQAETGSTLNRVAAKDPNWNCFKPISNHWAGLWAILDCGGYSGPAPTEPMTTSYVVPLANPPELMSADE